MEDVATSLPDVGFTTGGGDYGNVIEVSDLGDDMGMSLLANTKYTREEILRWHAGFLKGKFFFF
jgi:hypothetical protein